MNWFLWWLGDKESACQCRRRTFNPWRRKWQLTPVFLPGKSHGQRSLAGYSSWDHRRVRYNLLTKQSINKFYLFTVRVETILGTIITTNITMSNYSVFVISLLLSVRFMFSCCCLVCFNLKNSNISRVIREAGWS